MTKRTGGVDPKTRATRRGSRAVAPGGGGREESPAPATNEELRAERRARAIEEPLDVRVVQTIPFLALEVRNPVRNSHYRVLVPAFPSKESALCSCPDFARRGIGTCKHLEAVWLHLDQEPPTTPIRRAELRPATDLWAEIDRRLARLDAATMSGRALRSVGAVLVEPLGTR
ncbi:MAG TPA: hypothetical protein VGS18_05855 [Thermoplasmata archaeon]|nr:hypothetical protein [Thermoplasmata archaeon]